MHLDKFFMVNRSFGHDGSNAPPVADGGRPFGSVVIPQLGLHLFAIGDIPHSLPGPP